MYITKCQNKRYIEHTFGENQPTSKKILSGCGHLIFIIALIAGPMLLFSTLNPISTPNPVMKGELQFYILIEDSSKTDVDIPIFFTQELIQNRTLTQTAYDAMDFSNLNYDTNQYASSQSQTVQFSPVSDSVWTVSPPKREFLTEALINARNGTNPE